MDGVGGLEGWRWIFLLEGIFTVLLGLVTYFCLLDSPALSCKWLDQDEVRYLELRQRADPSSQERGRPKRENTASDTRKALLSVLTDWQICMHGIIYSCPTTPSSSRCRKSSIIWALQAHMRSSWPPPLIALVLYRHSYLLCSRTASAGARRSLSVRRSSWSWHSRFSSVGPTTSPIISLHATLAFVLLFWVFIPSTFAVTRGTSTVSLALQSVLWGLLLCCVLVTLEGSSVASYILTVKNPRIQLATEQALVS